MRLDWTCRRVDAATLVELRLENDADGPRRVRVENRLDGPVRPPRRGGRPAPGWSEAGYEGVLAPDEARALGYACPAPPADPPAIVAEASVLDDASERGAGGTRREPSAGGVVAALGDPRPPRDAVPTPDGSRETGSAPNPHREASTEVGAEANAGADADADSSTNADLDADANAGTGAGANAAAPDGGTDVSGAPGGRGTGPQPPTAVSDWLDDVAGRVESGDLAPREERALAVVGERVAAVQVALAERRRR